jgi:hypothetical protein
MPHIEPFYADKLLGSLGQIDAESVLDLRGVSKRKAEASLNDMLERSRFSAPKTVAILIDPPLKPGKQTLFQPVGRKLLAAKKSGWIDRLTPLPAQDGLGFYVALAGKS